MDFNVKLLPPHMPNFISIEQPVRPRQEGFTPVQIRVSELSTEQAEQYGELMKQTFQHHKDHLEREAKTKSVY